MWKLWHRLFGWDYIHWENSADEGIARIQKGYNGEVFYWRYKITSVADKITTAENVIWLTCEPRKWGL
jgi:hypothetical protein